MGYLIAEFSTFTLFVGFVALTMYERSRTSRLFPASRKWLDTRVSRVLFISSNVDLTAYLRDSVRNALERVIHDLARTALRATQFLEHQLSRIVSTMRARFAARHAPTESSTETSHFVKTIVDFKQELRDDRPAREKPRKF